MAVAVELFFALVSLLLGAAALRGSIGAWRLQSHPVDYAMRILACLWMLLLLITVAQLFLAGYWVIDSSPIEVITDIVYAILLGAVAFFLVTTSGGVRPWVLFVVALQVLGEIVAAVWLNFGEASTPIAFWMWTALNLTGAAAVTGSVIRQVRHTHSRRSWLALAACAMGIGLWLYQAAVPDKSHSALPVASHLYALFLFVIWKLVSLSPDADRALASAGTLPVGTSAFQSLNSVSSDDDFVALALRVERQRISYELHDNIGSQLVSVLFSMQAAEQPQKRMVMLSLEQCLADLKMTVDALDSFTENVTQALGRLRYRVQPALDRQRTQMRWDVEISAELEAVHGVYAQQVLRIAQESISNVMRHAKASSVRVTCRFEREFSHLLLEVSDNGAGMAPGKNKRSAGRGIDGMKRRAAAIGGFLRISNPSGGGTCVRLTLPLAHVKLWPESALPVEVKETAV